MKLYTLKSRVISPQSAKLKGKKVWKCKNVSGVARVVQKTDAQEESKNIAVEAF